MKFDDFNKEFEEAINRFVPKTPQDEAKMARLRQITEEGRAELAKQMEELEKMNASLKQPDRSSYLELANERSRIAEEILEGMTEGFSDHANLIDRIASNKRA